MATAGRVRTQAPGKYAYEPSVCIPSKSLVRVNTACLMLATCLLGIPAQLIGWFLSTTAGDMHVTLVSKLSSCTVIPAPLEVGLQYMRMRSRLAVIICSQGSGATIRASFLLG